MTCSLCPLGAEVMVEGKPYCFQHWEGIEEHIKKLKPGGSEFGRKRKSYNVRRRKDGKKDDNPCKGSGSKEVSKVKEASQVDKR